MRGTSGTLRQRRAGPLCSCTALHRGSFVHAGIRMRACASAIADPARSQRCTCSCRGVCRFERRAVRARVSCSHTYTFLTVDLWPVYFQQLLNAHTHAERSKDEYSRPTVVLHKFKYKRAPRNKAVVPPCRAAPLLPAHRMFMEPTAEDPAAPRQCAAGARSGIDLLNARLVRVVARPSRKARVVE